MTAAGFLSHRIRFERRGTSGDDGYGNVLEAWVEVATRWAAFRPQFGREAVAAGRLESTVLGVVTLRRDAVTQAIGAADRVVFATPPYFGWTGQVRSVVPTPDNADIEITVEIGVAT